MKGSGYGGNNGVRTPGSLVSYDIETRLAVNQGETSDFLPIFAVARLA